MLSNQREVQETGFIQTRGKRKASRLAASVIKTHHSGVFTQMSLKLPLFIVGRPAVGKRADKHSGSWFINFPHDKQENVAA